MLFHLGLQQFHGLALILAESGAGRLEFGASFAFELLQDDVDELFDRHDRVLFAQFLQLVIEMSCNHKRTKVSQ